MSDPALTSVAGEDKSPYTREGPESSPQIEPNLLPWAGQIQALSVKAATVSEIPKCRV